MNKFIAFALLAFVAAASAHVTRTGEEAETELLLGYEKLFSGFCIAQGQKIRNDLTEFTRQTSADITKAFFGSVHDITSDVINVQKDVVAQLTDQLAKPSSEFVDASAQLSEDEIAKLIQEGKEAIQETNGVAGILPATKTTFSAMLSTVNSAVFTRLAKARAAVSGLNLYESFKKACKKVADYEEEMAAALEEAKPDIAAQADDEDTKKNIEDQTIVSLNCYTTKNIVRLHGFCDIVQSGHKYFFKMLGMESPLQKYE